MQLSLSILCCSFRKKNSAVKCLAAAHSKKVGGQIPTEFKFTCFSDVHYWDVEAVPSENILKIESPNLSVI